MEIPDEVTRDIRQLDDLLRTQRTLVAKMEAVAEIIERVVGRCDAASVALIVEESMITGASSSQLAIEADLVQYRTGEGPCLRSADRQATIRIDALPLDERFVHFAPGAIDIGVTSVLSIPLVSGRDTVGSLNLYSRQADAFAEDVPDRIADLTAYAVDLIVGSQLHATGVEAMGRLVEVVQRSEQVEIAVGLLIVKHDMTPDQAWAHLQDRAGAEGVPVADWARRLVEGYERGLERPDDEPGA